MAKVGIIGGAGYTAGELLRLLVNHPQAEIVFVHSTSNAGHLLSDVHTGLHGETDMRFSDSHPLNEIDVLFLCSAHGHSRKFWEENERPACLKVIDLAQDYRDQSEGYVYGLPEVNLNRIKKADSVANPGCFATAIQLSLLPIAAGGFLPVGEDIHIVALTGSTGAGVKPGATTHFSWRTDNLSVYKPFGHQHLKEIGMTLESLQPGHGCRLTFIPMRGDFARGIFATVTLRTPERDGRVMTAEEVTELYRSYYAEAPFVVVSDKAIDLKQVVNTNKGILHIDTDGDRMLVTCAIDNLLKGASGQAVQNFNLLLGLDQREGLRLKGGAF